MTTFRLIALLILIPCALTGCTSLKERVRIPDGFTMRVLAKADARTPFAVDLNGRFAAIYQGKLQLIDPQGIALNIDEHAATVLCFSPSGDKLAAALPTGSQTLLRLFDRQGKVLSEVTTPERVTSMAWRSESQLLAATLGIRRLATGLELTSRLYFWDGSSSPVATTLSQVTLKRPLAVPPEQTLLRTFSLALSPYGDEIAYSSLQDEERSSLYQKVTVRTLKSGAEHEVVKTSVGSGGPIYSPDGDSLLVGDEQALTRRLSIPYGLEMDAWPSPGRYPAISSSGAFTLLDGTLYQDGRSVLSFPAQAMGAFLADGSGLAVSYSGKLYLMSGLKDQARPRSAAEQRHHKLRLERP